MRVHTRNGSNDGSMLMLSNTGKAHTKWRTGTEGLYGHSGEGKTSGISLRSVSCRGPEGTTKGNRELSRLMERLDLIMAVVVMQLLPRAVRLTRAKTSANVTGRWAKGREGQMDSGMRPALESEPSPCQPAA